MEIHATQRLPTWPATKLNQALRSLAAAADLPVQEGSFVAPPPQAIIEQPEELTQWILAAAAHAGLEGELFTVRHREIETLLRSGEPLILALPDREGDDARFLAVLRGRGRMTYLLDTDFQTRSIETEKIVRALTATHERQAETEIIKTLQAAGLNPSDSAKSIRGLLDQRLGDSPITVGWHLRLAPESSFWAHFRRDHLPWPAAGFILTYAAQYLLWLFSWWLLGRAFFQGRFDTGWLWAWILTLVTIIPLRAAATRLQGVTAIGVGGIIKKRLLSGALRLEPDETRHQGVGQLLGRVLESEAVETLLLNGGFLALAGGIELVFAAAVLSQGILPTAHLLFLAIWLVLVVGFATAFWRRRQTWTSQRLDLTHYMVEQMSGHKTRLAQTRPEDWHQEEDDMLAAFADQSRRMDHLASWLLAGASRGWLFLGAATLMPLIVNPPDGDQTLLAVSLGGLLTSSMALTKFVNGVLQLADALIAADKIKDLYKAAKLTVSTGTPALAVKQQIEPDISVPLLSVHNLTFCYRPNTMAVLRDLNLEIFAGDRILLESGSGGGKSTLAALLAGIRQPQSGLILLNGLDRQTIGQEGWRRTVAAAPQFHENHVVIGTFAFNLLMGRRWPPTARDLALARQVCADLGLDSLLNRMPAGMLQMIGETGWQLSHGEQSRLFLARALLQEADLLIFDESFAALDPQNLSRCLKTVLEQKAAVLVIAHP